MALTTKEIQGIKPGEWLSDGGARGAGVLVFRRAPSGEILAYFRYTTSEGKREAIPLGRYSDTGRDGLKLTELRDKAGEHSRLYQSGIRDLRAHFEAERIAQENAEKAAQDAEAQAAKAAEDAKRYTLRALCEAYTATLENKGKARSAAATRSAFKCHVFSHEEIANTQANQVTPLQIAAMVRKVREAGKERAAGTLRSYLSAAFNAAKRAPFDSALPADLIPFAVEHSPVDSIPAIATNRGQRTLSADELKAYIAALGESLADTALKLALYAGGQRMAQLLRATIADYDTETNTLRLWDGKGKRKEAREHLLPLAPVAASIVEALITKAKKRETERAKEEGREPAFSGLWLFSTHGRVPMTFETPGIRAAEISAGMKGEPFNLRDIRRTVETMLAGMGISKDTRAQLLSHGLSGVQSAHYDRHTYADEKRAALTAWEVRLNQITTGKTTQQNVIDLHAA